MNPIGLPATRQHENLSNSHTSNMTDYELEAYMALVASKVDVLGIHYVNRQVQWAEEQLRQRGVV